MALVKKFRLADTWEYSVYTPNTPAVDLGAAAEVKALWDSKREGNRLPAWRDFGIEDFKKWIGWVAVEDLVPGDAYDSVFRLWGGGLVTLFDQEITGKRFSDLIGVVYSPQERDVWTELSKTHNILKASGTMDWHDSFQEIKGMRLTDLTMPLADDGVTVNRYLSVTTIDPGQG